MGAFLAAALLLMIPAAEARARLLLSQKDALALAFPAGERRDKKTAFLTQEQVEAAQKLARTKVGARVWTYYVGSSTAGVTGYAYFDRVVVRTMPASVVTVLDAKGAVRFTEILTFDEPEDYRPRSRWLGLFAGRALDDDLRVRGGIHNIAGATLTAHAITDSVRRVIAVHQVLHGEGP